MSHAQGRSSAFLVVTPCSRSSAGRPLYWAWVGGLWSSLVGVGVVA